MSASRHLRIVLAISRINGDRNLNCACETHLHPFLSFAIGILTDIRINYYPAFDFNRYQGTWVGASLEIPDNHERRQLFHMSLAHTEIRL